MLQAPKWSKGIGACSRTRMRYLLAWILPGAKLTAAQQAMMEFCARIVPFGTTVAIGSANRARRFTTCLPSGWSHWHYAVLAC